MVIVSYLSVNHNRETLIPALSSFSKDNKTKLYWKCVVVFYSTSIRCNPKIRHLFYTDTTYPVIIDGINIIDFITNLGVEIHLLKFEKFVPPDNCSRIFQSAFYKFDVFKALEKENESNFLVLDVDCIWTKRDNKLINLIKKEKLILYDVFEQINPDAKISNLSRRDMGEIFKQVDQNYPNEFPIRFGGEFMACDINTLKIMNSKADQLFQSIVLRYGNNPPIFKNGMKIFDGNEPFGSFLYNYNFVPWKDARGFIKRNYSSKRINTVLPEDLNIPIWHMPDEKSHGIPSLFNMVVNKQSEFWSTPIEQFNRLLGGNLGVPVRTRKFQRKSNLIKKFTNKLRYFHRIYFK
jgi:hypothetical protein